MGTPQPLECVSFRTKVDPWVVVVLVGAFLLTLMGAVNQLGESVSATQAMAAFAPLLAYCAIIGLCGVPTRYELGPRALVVRSGLFRYRVSYEDIRSISPTRSPLAAPAWSLDRLRIEKANGYLLISPKDKATFVEALRARAPQVTQTSD
jgi:hypothetical protein